MDKIAFFQRTMGGLIVSCQSVLVLRGTQVVRDYNTELSDPVCMAGLARAAEAGGAAGIRTNLRYVNTIREATKDLPIIGLEKIACFESDMRITPTMDEVSHLVDAGADAVAIDCTNRPRLDGLSVAEFISRIKENYEVVVIADISTLEEGLAAAKAGADAVTTTLAGYTTYSLEAYGLSGSLSDPPTLQLVEELAKACPAPVVAEGRFRTPDQAAEALRLGAHAVVVGGAITVPRDTTQRFVEAMRGPTHDK
jgi:N-acylglucosamine-6-phosphate 2-epimerase